MKTTLIILSLCMLLVATSAQQPLAPYWPSQFAQDFVETFTMDNGNFTNVGTYQYEAATGSTRLSRSNGKYDPFCNGYLNFDQVDAPCEHLIVNNTRYMYYPDTQDCCYCCSGSEGCGILSQGWIQDGEFLGTTEVFGTEAYQWVLYEGPNLPNYLWETTETNPLDRQILKIARNNYVELYIQGQYRRDLQSISLPGQCSLSNQCPRGVCPELREDSFFEA